jgi:SAM-dependent methyltransferase
MQAKETLKRLIPKPCRRLVRTSLEMQPLAWFHRLEARWRNRPPNYARLWQAGGQKWALEGAAREGNLVRFWGWALIPPPARARARLVWNERPLDRVEFPVSRPDVGQVFSFLPFASDSGFNAWAPIGSAVLRAGELVSIRWVDRHTDQPFFGRDLPYYYPLPAADEVLPDAGRRRRVHGNWDVENFRVLGATAWMRLRTALQSAGRDVRDFGHVLDFGCGCGRVTRYFRDAMPRELTGVDVDADNLRWCQAHLPFARFLPVPLHAPTPLAAEAFDLVIGISIFTHLQERVQFEWLTELNRLCRSDALLLLTFNGEGAACMFGMEPRQFREFARAGFLALPHPEYDADLPEKDYYLNVFHTRKYVRKHWSRYFRIEKILPGYVGQQDLVVLRKC